MLKTMQAHEKKKKGEYSLKKISALKPRILSKARIIEGKDNAAISSARKKGLIAFIFELTLIWLNFDGLFFFKSSTIKLTIKTLKIRKKNKE
jgi:hypothetical protein